MKKKKTIHALGDYSLMENTTLCNQSFKYNFYFDYDNKKVTCKRCKKIMKKEKKIGK